MEGSKPMRAEGRWIALAVLFSLGCSGTAGPVSSTGSSGTGAGTSGSGSSGSAGASDCDAGLGSGTVEGFAGYPGVRAAVLVPGRYSDVGSDSTRLAVVLAADYYPAGCTSSPIPNTDRFTLTVEDPAGVRVGSYASPIGVDGGAKVSWYLGGETSGGSFDATRAEIVLNTLAPGEATGTFNCDMPDQRADLLEDGGRTTVRVTGDFDALTAPEGVGY